MSSPLRASFALLLLVSVGFGACAKKDEEEEAACGSACSVDYTTFVPQSAPVDFRDEVVPLMRRACTGTSCHGLPYRPAAGLYIAPPLSELFVAPFPTGCGNGRCEPTGADVPAETTTTCPEDCTTCGDGLCGPRENCAADCGACGDGTCGAHEVAAACRHGEACTGACGDGAAPVEPGEGTCGFGETVASCPNDCDLTKCGDGSCGSKESAETCPEDCGILCPADCAATCGGGELVGTDWILCQPGETAESCPRDCRTAACGDGKCGVDENAAICPFDCGTCGDGTCGYRTSSGGDCDADCAETCGNWVCDAGETSTSCPVDCLPDAFYPALLGRLVGVPSKTARWPGGPPVDIIDASGDPGRSFLVLKVDGCQNEFGFECTPQDDDATECGVRMPDVAESCLSRSELALLRSWVAQGATDTGP